MFGQNYPFESRIWGITTITQLISLPIQQVWTRRSSGPRPPIEKIAGRDRAHVTADEDCCSANDATDTFRIYFLLFAETGCMFPNSDLVVGSYQRVDNPLLLLNRAIGKDEKLVALNLNTRRIHASVTAKFDETYPP